ncbi:DUF5134 domain-containing protein [Streptomyces sp. NBC_01538]|uniref:DUF5134 domain-containing protein n=1 Tax=Streptomyces sp. NBC_01538 TaxID=2903897 RepID=UPI00386937AA
MRVSAEVGWLMSGLMAVVGIICLARLVRGGLGVPRRERELDASEVVKSLGMAVMALPCGAGRSVPEQVWVAVYGGAALWSAAAALRSAEHRGHRLHHGVGHAAMVYMAVAMAAPMASMSHMGPPPGLPWLTMGLLLFFAGSALVAGARLVGASAGGRADPGRPAAAGLLWGPEVPRACRIALGLGMVTMLLAM